MMASSYAENHVSHSWVKYPEPVQTIANVRPDEARTEFFSHQARVLHLTGAGPDFLL